MAGALEAAQDEAAQHEAAQDEAGQDEAAARADEALDRFLPPRDEAVARTHHVTALLISHQGAAWLPRTLSALAGQTRAPDAVVGVDAGSTDGSAGLVEHALGAVLVVPAEEGLAGALGAAVLVDTRGARADAAAQPTTDQRDPSPDADDVVSWYWIVHDDSAPQPGCLAALLDGADRNLVADVLVPKSVAWADPGRLVGIGHRWAPGVPVVERLEPRERDQGQYDVDRPVHSGDAAGMLVRTEVWHALSGMVAEMGDWAGAADLCRRVWALGGQVTFIPAAVIAHRQAGHRGVRPSIPADRPPRRTARHGQLLLELTQAPTSVLVWRWFRGWVSTFLRAVALLLTREPEEASAELAGAWDALAHPRRLARARRAVRRPPIEDLTRPAHVRAPRGAVLAHSLDAWAAASRGRTWRLRPRVPRHLWFPLAIAAALAAASLVRDPGTLLGSGTLRGGGLLPAPSAGQLISTYLDSWQEVRFGVPSGLPAYLPLLAAASLPLLGSVDLLLRLVFGLAVPLAFLSAYASLAGHAVGRHRMSLSLAWALLPAGVAAAGAGRISTLVLLLLAPPTARLVADALLRARRGDRSLRPALAAGVMLGLTSAFAPSAGVLVVSAGVVAWILARLPRWPVRSGLVMLACAASFVALWGVRVVRAPWLLLSDLGRNDPTLAEPAPWPIGLSPGGPTAVGWAGVGLLALSVLLVVLRAPRGRHLAGLAVGVGLLVLVAWVPVAADRLWPGLAPGTIWPGQLLLLAAGVLAVTAAHLVAAREHPRAAADGSAGSAGAGLVPSVAGLAWLGVVAALAVGWWQAPRIVEVGSETGIPPVVGLAEQTVERPRALVLARAADAIRYGVSAGPLVPLGSADALAAPYLDPAFADVVEALVSGAGGDLEGQLGGRGVRYVVFDGPQADPLVPELDAAIGLRRLASAPDQSLWLVTGQPARAELVGGPDDPDVLVPISTTPTSIDVVLHPQAVLPRTLQLAESADPGWRATSAGEPVTLSGDARGMLSGSITRSGALQVVHTSPWPWVAGGQLVVMAALVVLALPKRRALDLDADPTEPSEDVAPTEPVEQPAPGADA